MGNPGRVAIQEESFYSLGKKVHFEYCAEHLKGFLLNDTLNNFQTLLKISESI